ncbi:hypothetical protein AB0L63_01830 [Nocardia sp. NPDC051990]|uniref:hypothetical protein n=1 Tax=Nocardia sp. NPDC051990 TaxID=3155285 RepID=UPI003425B67B
MTNTAWARPSGGAGNAAPADGAYTGGAADTVYAGSAAPAGSSGNLMCSLGRAVAVVAGASLIVGLSACTIPGKPMPEQGAAQSRVGEDPNTANVEHFARIRAAEPCATGESDVLKKYGPVQKPDGDVYLFYLDLNVHFDSSDTASAEPGRVAGRQAYRTSVPNDRTTHRSCTYKVPYAGVDCALSLRLVRTPPKGAPDSPWPEACASAAEYLESIYPKIDQLRPNPHPAPGDIVGQDRANRRT